MMVERAARGQLGRTDVDLACTRARSRRGGATSPIRSRNLRTTGVALAAVQACLGSAEGHARVLRALVGGDDDEVGIAQVYLRHRPIADAGELRSVATGVARMPGSDAQVRALDTLASHRLSDPRQPRGAHDVVPAGALASRSQRAIAGVLIRADHRALARADLAKTLKRSRLKSPDGADMIDVLIRRLEAS